MNQARKGKKIGSWTLKTLKTARKLHDPSWILIRIFSVLSVKEFLRVLRVLAVNWSWTLIHLPIPHFAPHTPHLYDEHRVTVAVEAVVLRDGGPIGRKDLFPSRER